MGITYNGCYQAAESTVGQGWPPPPRINPATGRQGLAHFAKELDLSTGLLYHPAAEFRRMSFTDKHGESQ